MSRDLDTRARQAATALKAAVEATELRSTLPSEAVSHRPLVAVLRPAIVMALLLIGAAIGVALVADSSPSETTAPAVPTTVVVPTTLAAAEPAAPPLAAPPTVYVAPAPSSTVAADVEPPRIEVTSPQDGAVMETKTVTFQGVTEPGARVFAGRWEADVEASGEWHIVLILSEGANVARFTATDAAGNEARASVTVHYVIEEPATTTTTIEKELAEFSANATFGSCAETPPYDIYHGSGEPGSVVTIKSEYGSASVEINQKGNWEKKVVFETAPPNQAFVVTISDEFGRKKQFEFVYEPA